jgi:hypothetical protein
MDLLHSREPLTLAAGDTVCFKRNFEKYPANQGWQLEYTAVGGGSLIEWTSTLDADGATFDINVAPAITAQYVPGNYDLEGFAVNTQTGERHSFYFNQLLVTPNLQAVQPGQDVSTHAQRMLRSLEATLEKMAQHDLNDSSTEGVELHRKRMEEVRVQRDHYLREVENEQDKLNARTGKPSRKKIRTRLLVTQPNGTNPFGVGNNPWNFD